MGTSIGKPAVLWENTCFQSLGNEIQGTASTGCRTQAGCTGTQHFLIQRVTYRHSEPQELCTVAFWAAALAGILPNHHPLILGSKFIATFLHRQRPQIDTMNLFLHSLVCIINIYCAPTMCKFHSKHFRNWKCKGCQPWEVYLLMNRDIIKYKDSR